MNVSWLKNLVENVKLHFNFSRKNSPTIKTERNTTARGRNVHQIGTINIQSGMSYSEVKNLVSLIVDQKLIEVRGDAEVKYNLRIKEFKDGLLEEIKKLSPEEVDKLKEPDVQLAMLEATSISGRKQSSEIESLLSRLVIERIKNENPAKEELKNIVFNEAITTIRKLTLDQLKIITLCYILRSVRFGMIHSDKTFEEYLQKKIQPFIDFKNTRSEFQHIVYAGCASISVGQWDLLEIYRKNYSILFLNPVEQSEVETLNISEKIKTKLFVRKEDGLFIPARNESELREYLEKNKVSEESIRTVVAVYDKSIKNQDEVKKYLEEIDGLGKKVYSLWNDTDIKHMSLTSVGIVIAATFFKQITGDELNIDIWIN